MKKLYSLHKTIFVSFFLLGCMLISGLCFGQITNTFTASGTTNTTGNITIPSGSSIVITVQGWAGGGGGGGGEGSFFDDGAAGGGGGGGFAKGTVTLSNGVYTYQVGGGGSAGTASAGNGAAGGATYFAGFSGIYSIEALGGGAGHGANANSGGSAAGGGTSFGASVTGQTSHTGGGGEAGSNGCCGTGDGAGGGGGGAGSTGNGGTPTTYTQSAVDGGGDPGAGGSGGGGSGGIGASDVGNTGTDGSTYGGGGGGGEGIAFFESDYGGGNGAAGHLTITYTMPSVTFTSVTPSAFCGTSPAGSMTITGEYFTDLLGTSIVTAVSIGGVSIPLANLSGITLTNITVSFSGVTLPVGNNTLTVTTSTGAVSYGSPIVISNAAPATPGSINGPVSQCPGATGQVYGVSPVAQATTYTWSVPAGWSITAGQGTDSITVTAGTAGTSGTISVTAGNSCGTSAARTLGVIVVALPVITSQPVAETVCTTTGPSALTFGVSGGVGTFTYQWYSNTVNSTVGATALVGTNSFSFIPANTVGTLYYFATAAESGAACGSLTSSVVKVQVDAASVGGTVSGGTTPICQGSAPGTLTLSGQTGTILHWDSNSTSIADVTTTYIPGMIDIAGSYTYTATVQNGTCAAATSAGQTIVVDSTPVFTAPASVCDNGMATLSTGLATTHWSATNGTVSPAIGASTTFTPDSISTSIQNQNAIVTATNGPCSYSQTIRVDNKPVIGGVPVATCNSTPTLAITSSVSGNNWSVSAGTISPSTGAGTTLTLPAIAAPTASMNVTVTDSNGTCSSTATVRVDNNPTITAPASVCNTATTVAVSSNITGTIWSATGGGSFSPDTATGTTYTIPAVTPPVQNKTVVVIATNGTCISSDSLRIDDQPAITSSGADLCQGSSVTLANNIGNTGVFFGTGVTADTFTAPVQSSGTVSSAYTITLTNGNCSTTQNINSFNQPDISPAIPALCPGGTYNLNSSSNLGGGGAFSGTGVSGSTFTATTTPSAPYQGFLVTLSSAPCVADTQTVRVYQSPTAYAVTGGGYVCPGQTSGGPSVFLSNSQAGVNYQLYVNNIITGAAQPGSNGSPISFGAQATPGTYIVIGALAASPFCSSNMLDSAVITTVPLPTPYALVGGGAYCSGDTGRNISMANTDVNVTYSLYNGVSLVAGPLSGTGSAVSFGTFTAAGAYSARGTNLAGCDSAMLDTIHISILTLPVVDSVNSGSLSCFGGSNDTIRVYAVTTNGNLFYSINGGTSYLDSNGIFPNLPAGNYYVAVRDDSSCRSAYGANPVHVTSPLQILLSIASFGNVLCYSDSTGYIDLSAAGGTGQLTFAWSNGATSQNISHLAAGTYMVTATDANGCQGTMSQAINQPAPLTDSISSTNITCYDADNGTATFIVGGGSPPYKYLWSNGDTSQTISNLNGAVYSVTATDNNHCIAVSSVNIINPQPIAITLTVSNVSCHGDSNGTIVANVTGGSGAYTYTWSPNVSTTNTINNATLGTYVLRVTDVNNCFAVDSAIVTQPLTALSISSIEHDITCHNANNGSIEILASGGTGGYTYSYTGTSQTTSTVNNLSLGNYTVTVTDGNGCSASLSDTIHNPSAITDSIFGINVLCGGSRTGFAAVNVSGGTPPYSYLWSNFASTPTIDSLSGGLYYVIITDSNGCQKRIVSTSQSRSRSALW